MYTEFQVELIEEEEEEVQKEGKLIGMDISFKRAREKKKSEWKKECKQLINKEAERMEKANISQMKKLRFLGTERGRHTYLTETHNDDARRAIRIRLNMETYIKTNFGMKGSCPLCGLTDSTEHIFTCTKFDDQNQHLTLNNLKNGTHMKEIIELFKRTEKQRSCAIKEFVYREIDAILSTNTGPVL